MRMNKYIIPIILAGIVLTVGIFGFQPADQATAIHEGLIDNLSSNICHALEGPSGIWDGTDCFTIIQT